MSVFVPAYGQDWAFFVDSFAGGTQPSATAGNGTSVTCAQNAFSGGYTNILSSLAQDIQLLEIQFSANAVSAAARDTLVNLSLDGGSTVWIQELLASCAGGVVKGVISYLFPIYVKSGVTISAAASVNNAAPGTMKVRMRAWGQPRDPRHVRVGSFVRSFGTTPATSKGTDITAGQAAEGTYVQLGSNTADRLWWWQVGMGVNNSAMNNFWTNVDLGIGDGSTKRVVIPDQAWITSSGEDMFNMLQVAGCEYDAPAGVGVYGRAQSSGAIVNVSLAGYGVGG